MDIKISILNEFNKEVSTYITDLDSYELLKKHNIPIQDKIDEMIRKVYFNQVSENNQTEDLVKIPNGDNFFTSEQQLDIPSHLRWHNSKPKQETLEEVAERYYEDEVSINAFINGAKWQAERIYSEEELPKNLESVLAKITHQNDLGLSQWHEVVYYDNDDDKWCCYSGSKTFQDGERVIAWKYCKDLI